MGILTRVRAWSKTVCSLYCCLSLVWLMGPAALLAQEGVPSWEEPGSYAEYFFCNRIPPPLNKTIWGLQVEGPFCGTYGWKVLGLREGLVLVQAYLNVSTGTKKVFESRELTIDRDTMWIMVEGRPWGRWVFFLTPREVAEGNVTVMRRWFSEIPGVNNATITRPEVVFVDKPLQLPTGYTYQSYAVLSTLADIPPWVLKQERLNMSPTVLLQYVYHPSSLLLLGYFGTDDVLLNLFGILKLRVLEMPRDGKWEFYRGPASLVLYRTNLLGEGVEQPAFPLAMALASAVLAGVVVLAVMERSRRWKR